MTTKKQSRAAEQRRLARRAQREEALRRQRELKRRRMFVTLAFVLSVALVATVVWLAARSPESTTGDGALPGESTPITGGSDLPPGNTNVELETGWAASSLPPDPSLAESRTWAVTINTNQGPISLELDGISAPQAVASFVALAGDGFFDQTECHRITTQGIFVLQCGDPLANGMGGPTYRFGPIENAPADGFYPAGTLAMARPGNDAYGMGSQFFVVYEDSTIMSDSAGGYTVFGRVTSGLDIVQTVAKGGTITGAADGRPAMSVIITEVTAS